MKIIISINYIKKKTVMSISPRNFYNGWNLTNNTNDRITNLSLRRSFSHEHLDEKSRHLEQNIYQIEKDIDDIKDELTLLRYHTGKISDYLKDIQKLNVYERELQLLQIKNVILETVPNMIAQIVPEIIDNSTREDEDYPDEEIITASHIQDISNKTSISVSSQPFLCSICHSNVEENDVIRSVNHCSHAFHIKCLETWLGQHNNCPLCRFEI